MTLREVGYVMSEPEDDRVDVYMSDSDSVHSMHENFFPMDDSVHPGDRLYEFDGNFLTTKPDCRECGEPMFQIDDGLACINCNERYP